MFGRVRYVDSNYGDLKARARKSNKKRRKISPNDFRHVLVSIKQTCIG